MALFPRWSDSALRLGLGVALAGALALLCGPMVYVRTPYATEQYYPIDQPVQFDHRHHVGDDGIDCRYCHHTVEKQAWAGVPSTDLCMGCHSQVWIGSPLLEPLRRSDASGLPMPWRRVHQLPDFVYFNHAAHVSRGVGCPSCHGRVDTMPVVHQVAPLTMGWCLDCHRHPEAKLAARPGVQRFTNCTACHR